MASFGFGQPPPNTTAPGNTLFGAKPATPGFGAGMGFGTPNTFGTPAPFGSTTAAFGSTPAPFGSTAPPFGGTAQPPVASVAPQPSNLFGGAPATSQTGGFFGGNTSTPGLLGTSSTPQGGLFGAPAPSSALPTAATAAPAVSQPGLSFGTPSTQAAPTGLFGAPASTAPQLFPGAQPNQAPSAFGATPAPFGATPAPSFSAAPAPSFSAAPAPSFSAAPAPSFGAAPATSFSAAPATSFSAAPATSFGAAPATSFSAAPAPSFGGTSSAFSTGSSAFVAASTAKPGGLFTATNTSAPTLSFALTTPSTAAGVKTSAAATVFPFNTSSSLPATSFGGPTALFGKPTPTPGTIPVTSTPSVGLGGIDTSLTTPGLSSLPGLAGASNARQETKTVKENPIPNEVAQHVESFRQYVKQQKSLSCEVARCSAKPLQRVQEDTDAMKLLLASCSSGLQRCRSIADKLKADTAKGLQHTEMAQRTHDTPPGLQYDNTAPLQYFAELVSGFERDIQLFRQEIENAERHVHSQCQPTSLSPGELTQAMRRLYDSFVALAGRLHTIHSQVKVQKDQYLSFRKYKLNDATDVFEEAARSRGNAGLGSSRLSAATRTTAGPTPFSNLGSQHGLGLFSVGTSSTPQQPFAPLGWSSAQVPAQPQPQPMFPTTTPFPQPPENPFQLQKPPLGNKRGKR